MSPIRRRTGRQPLTEPLERFLITGEYGGGTQFSFDIFLLAGEAIRGNFSAVRALWTEYGASLLARWLIEHPGERPYAWWLIDAPEPRQCLDDPGRHVWPVARWPEYMWRQRRGIPLLDQIGHFTVTFESQAAYLDRLGLLGAAERLELSPDVFEPERITIAVDTLEELVARWPTRGDRKDP
jgi:hypothetical protein